MQNISDLDLMATNKILIDISSYLFNAQLVTLPSGEQALVVPTEATATPSVKRWFDAHLAGNGPIRQVLPVDVRQSMANGGGPACLRLRVVADPARVDPRFLCTAASLDRAVDVVSQHWPESIAPADLADPDLAVRVTSARASLLSALDLKELG